MSLDSGPICMRRKSGRGVTWGGGGKGVEEGGREGGGDKGCVVVFYGYRQNKPIYP